MTRCTGRTHVVYTLLGQGGGGWARSGCGTLEDKGVALTGKKGDAAHRKIRSVQW